MKAVIYMLQRRNKRHTTATRDEKTKVEVFEASPGVWKFRFGTVTCGNFDCYERARNVAESYNCFKVETITKEYQCP